jgi:multiple sugar transport system ATP-binding protein
MTMADRIVIMKDGIVQQVGRPMELYDHPVNRFVAGFIGSPQMNMISARVAEAGGEILLEFEDNRLALEGARAKALRDGGYVGKTVTLGIRPEHIYDARTTEKRPGLLHFQTQVRVYEMLGANALVYFDMGQAGWVASVDATVQQKSGDVISLALDTAKVHVFDSESEMAIEG